MASVLKRLLKYPHRAVFDTTPGARPALSVQRAGGITWSVVDEKLTAQAGLATYTYDLSAMTIGQLAAALQADGFTVTGPTPEFSGLGASVLVEATGSDGTLMGFTSLLWSLFGGYARELRAAAQQIPEAINQMVITLAEGEWLDLWGALFNVPRAEMTDAAYQPAIPREAFRRRVNAIAIEKAILDATGKDVLIEEPWELMFRLDESRLSGSSRFYDGGSVGYHLIRPVSRIPISFDDVLPVIERNRGAGIVVLAPEIRIGTEIVLPINTQLSSCITSESCTQLSAWIANRLSLMVLSAEDIARNWSRASIEPLGFTWGEMESWHAVPWSLSYTDLDQLDAAVAVLLNYADVTMHEDF